MLNRLRWSQAPGLHQALLIVLGLSQVTCQGSDNTPPVMWLDRNWRIPSNEQVGSVVTKVRASDAERDPLSFGLEPKEGPLFDGVPLPFTIDNSTGVVYLNESLSDKIGKNILLYVTVSDGKLNVKNEVWVQVYDSNSTSSNNHGVYVPQSGNPNRNRPPFIPNYNPIDLPPMPHNFNLGPLNEVPTRPETNTVTKRVQTHTYIEKDETAGGDLVDNNLSPTDSKYDHAGVNDNLISENHVNGVVNHTESAVRPVSNLTVTIVPIIAVFLVFLTAGVISVVFWKKLCPVRTKSKKSDMSKEPNGGIVLQEAPPLAIQGWRGPRAFKNRYESGGEHHLQTSTSMVGDDIKTPTDRWEFPRHRLKVFDILGEGAFGQVWRCEATDIDGKQGPSTVAVKTLKENASEKERSDLLSELQVMKTLDPHPNVVRLIACCTDKEPIFVIMEYITLGKLQAFLRDSRAERHYGNIHAGSKTLSSKDLTSFVYQVAKGMEFLSSKGIIHRDLAARNILITDDHVCKVADFGFARDVVTSLVYERKSEGRLPIRWMAPESLYDDIFSVKSDVWSFGILIWEVVTLGSTPYPGLSAGEVMKKVRDGHRLEKPEHCRRELYNIMFYCWDNDPAERPTFSECVTLLEKLLMTETDYIELERFPDHSYYNVINHSGEKV